MKFFNKLLVLLLVTSVVGCAGVGLLGDVAALRMLAGGAARRGMATALVDGALLETGSLLRGGTLIRNIRVSIVKGQAPKLLRYTKEGRLIPFGEIIDSKFIKLTESPFVNHRVPLNIYTTKNLSPVNVYRTRKLEGIVQILERSEKLLIKVSDEANGLYKVIVVETGEIGYVKASELLLLLVDYDESEEKSKLQNCSNCQNGTLTCHDCKGKKSAVCNECKGAEFITCTYCKGAPIIDCIKCNGAGSLDCFKCSGTGKSKEGAICRDCLGNAKLLCTECMGNKNSVCSQCMGNSKWLCTTCYGNGYVLCENCFSTGLEVCQKCNGYRLLF